MSPLPGSISGTVGTALIVLLFAGAGVVNAATAGTVTSISSFQVDQSPSGMFYNPAHKLIYVLCGTQTNGDHRLFGYTTDGAKRCDITIPQSAGMSRVDGFHIVGSTAYIVDSQGPIYAAEPGKLGGSLYAVEWSNPCDCNSEGVCTTPAVTAWSPVVNKTYTLDADTASIGDGGGVDDFFRNSGVVIINNDFLAVNGVHPAGAPGDLACCYTKSIVRAPLSGTGTPVTQKWSFDASTLGRDIDMEGLTCGADNCASSIYVGDEYNYVYKLNLGTADAAAAVTHEWNLRSIVGSVPDDKGIEAITYAASTGFFYVGIQETSTVHIVQLTENANPSPPSAPPSTPSPPSPTTLNPFFTDGFADPSRRVSFYTLPADAAYSPSGLPGVIYLFRTGATLDSAAVLNQRPVLGGNSGDLRQVAIVVVPSGSMVSELVSEAQVISSGLTIAVQSNVFCNCPIKPSTFQYAHSAHSTTYPSRSVFRGAGVAATVLDFGLVSNASRVGSLYRQLDIDGNTLGYLIDSVPGDFSYTPMRRLFTVTVPSLVSTLVGLAGLILSDAGQFVNSPVTAVSGADEIPETFALMQGYSKGRRVSYYDFNSSRVTTSVATPTSVRFARMYFLSTGQATPIVDVVPGSSLYSDLWAITTVDVPLVTNVTFPVTSASAIPASWVRRFTGTFLNCPIVNANSSLAVPSHATKTALFYQETVRYCFNFSYALGCAPRAAFTLRRDDLSFVEGNDLFGVLPSLDVDYSALSSLMTYAVPQFYVTGTTQSVAGLVSPPAIGIATSQYANRPIVQSDESLRSPTSYTYNLSVTSRDGLHDAVLYWSVNGSRLDIQVVCASCDGYIGIGFGGSSAHDGVFVLGFIDATGTACVRQVQGTGQSRTTLADHVKNAFNVTDTALALLRRRGSVVTRFQFSRSITITDSEFARFSLGTNVATRLSLVTRHNALPGCVSTAASDLAHDFAFTSSAHIWIPNGTFTFTAVPTTLASSLTPAPTTPSPLTTNISLAGYSGAGEYLCDTSVSFTWSIDFTSLEITFAVAMPSGYVGWFGLGVGAGQMAGSDIITVLRTPTGGVSVQDRKGIQQALPPLDDSQDATFVSTSAGSVSDVFTFKRKLNTDDIGTSAQPATRTVLASQSFHYRTGWAHGVLVAYYDFDNGPSFGSATATATSTMYVFVSTLPTSASEASVHEWQDAVVGRVPGQPGYSDLWDVIYVLVPTTFEGPEIKSVASIPTAWTQQAADGRIMCPIVHSGSSVDLSLPTRSVWFRNSLQKCFEFPAAAYATNRVPQRMLQLVSNATNVTVDVLFDKLASDTNYSSFVWRHFAVVPDGYVVGSWTNLEQFVTLSGYTVVEAGVHSNVPVVHLNNVTFTFSPDPTLTVAPTTTIDPAVLALYEHQKILHATDGVAKVVLHWTYNYDALLLSVMVIAYDNIGYAAIGFSNSSYTKMQEADIVLGYVDAATGVPCIRVLYSVFDIGGPSGASTMFIRNPTVELLGGATVLRFERTFNANAHGAGVIPTPAQGATSRIIYAAVPTSVSMNCSSTAFAGLYHFPENPHGSVSVNWLGITTTPSPVGITPSPSAPTAVLLKTDLQRKAFYFRGFAVPFYCAPIDFAVATSVSDVPAPVMYVPVDSTGRLAQAPLLTTTIGSSEYTGLWRVVYAVVPANWTAVGSVAQLLSGATAATSTFTNETAYRNCPLVHAETTVEVRDRAAYPKVTVYYSNQLLTCLDFGALAAAPRIDYIWNGTAQTAPVVDSVTSAFKRAVAVTSTTAFVTAEGIASQITLSSTVVRNCIAVASALDVSLRGSQVEPSSVAYQVEAGFFEGRRVSFFRHQSAMRFANAYEVTINSMYVIKSGPTASSADRQSRYVVNVTVGNGQYSDIWRIVVVDASNVTTSGDITSVAALASLPQYPTGLYVNCPIVSSSSTFAGVGVTLRTLYIDGRTISCANFGFVTPPPSRIPTVRSLYTSSGSILTDNSLFSSAPGMPSFYPLQWVVKTTLSSALPPSLTSLAALNTTIYTDKAQFTVWNVFITAVAVGSGQSATLPSMTLKDTVLQRLPTDVTALMASPVVFNLTAAIALPAPPSFSTVYVFRRGLRIDDDGVTYQAPIIATPPGLVQYTATGGSGGYSDIHTVVIVNIPTNASTTVITNVDQLQIRLSSGAFTANRSSGIVATLFVGVNTTSLAATAVSCPTLSLWSADQALTALDCGFTRAPARAEIEVSGAAGSLNNTLRSRDLLGRSLYAGVPLSVSNGNLIQDFATAKKAAYAGGHPAIVHDLQLLSGVPLSDVQRGTKYVFRDGPTLYSSNAVGLPALMEPLYYEDGAPVFANVWDVVVVNVAAGSATFAVADLPASVPSKATMLALAEERCWGLEATGRVEIGRMLLAQNTLSTLSGLAHEPAVSGGSLFNWVSAAAVNSARATDTSNIAVAIINNSTGAFSHYLLGEATLTAARAAAVRRYFTLTATAPLAYLSLNSSVLAVATEEGTLILHTSFVSLRSYVALPTMRAITRSTGFFDSRGVQYYDLGAFMTTATAASPIPIYYVRIVSTGGGVVATSGYPVITHLPGHEGYSDLHQVFRCDIPEAVAASVVPATSEQGVLTLLAQGTITSCTAGELRNMAIVHADTTVETRDVYDGLSNPTGVRYATVVFDEARFRALDFGVVTVAFSASADLVALLRRETSGALVTNPAVFARADVLGTASASTGSFKREVRVVVGDAYVTGTVADYTAIGTVAVQSTVLDVVHNLPVVAMDSLLPSFLYDDIPIIPDTMDVIWAYGALSSAPPYELQQHTLQGTARINFFTGASDQPSNPPVESLGYRRVQFGTAFVMSWSLRAPAEHPRRADDEQFTYSPEETEIVFTVLSRTNSWIAFGFSPDGRMPNSEIYLAYASDSVVSVGSGTPFVHLSERYSTDYTTPRDIGTAASILTLEHTKINSGGTGFEMTFSRPLVPANGSKHSIDDNTVSVIWAQGSWDVSTSGPSKHSQRGSTSINFISGDMVEVPERKLSYWYIAVLVVAVLLVIFGGLLLRIAPPSFLLHYRPFSRFTKSATSLFGAMVVVHYILLLLMLGVVICWFVGASMDMRDSRFADPWWRGVGSAAQLVFCFVFLPLPRHNVILWILGTSFHKARRWFYFMQWLFALLVWIHGIAMFVVGPNQTSTVQWWGGVIALVAVTAYLLTLGGVVTLPTRAAYYVNGFLWLVLIVFVCIHKPITAAGLVPTFLAFLFDWILRFKDRRQRSGTVRSYAVPTRQCVAIEVSAKSPWHGCCPRPFTVRPGAFVYALVEGWPHPVPFMISSRVTQEEGDSHATFTAHVRGTVPDAVRAAAPATVARKSGDEKDEPEMDNFEQFVLRCAGQRKLGNRTLYLEGGYGGVRLNLKHYRTLLCVCGGAGLGPSLSLVETLVYDPDYFRRTSVQAVKVLWVVREPEDLLMFADELHELLHAALPLNLQFFVFVTKSSNPIVTALEQQQQQQATPTRSRYDDADEEDAAPNNDRFDAIAEVDGDSPDAHIAADGEEVGGNDDNGTLPRRSNRHYSPQQQTPPRNTHHRRRRVDPGALNRQRTMELALTLPKHPLFDELQVFYGRPVLTQFFAEQRTTALKKGERSAAVHVSAPPEMAGEVMLTADAVSELTTFQFHLDIERYDTIAAD
jgi:NAD(P)H-flavin reductase